MLEARRGVKRALGALRHLDRAAPLGMTVLIYHRVGGGTSDELDLLVGDFAAQLDLLVERGHDVLSLDAALDRLDAGDQRPAVVLTFDDGFADVHDRAFPLLFERALPFTLYLAAGCVGGSMRWEGSSAASQGARALSWEELSRMRASGLCTVANHTLTHASPEDIDIEELDRCSDMIEARLGEPPAHFAWTWGIPVPSLLPGVRQRFRSAATGCLGRNLPPDDRHALRRIPVRASDPLSFFEAKLTGDLWLERSYTRLVRTTKSVSGLARDE